MITQGAVGRDRGGGPYDRGAMAPHTASEATPTSPDSPSSQATAEALAEADGRTPRRAAADGRPSHWRPSHGLQSGWRPSHWLPSMELLRRLAFTSLLANIGIVATGGLVRLTNSGLGCPTWPECGDGSLVPTHQVSWHKAVEFGNRTLFVVVFGAALAVFVAARRRTPAGSSLRRWAWITLLGGPVQAVVGGILTLTNLNPWVVCGHFLLSMLLIAAATVLWWRAREPAEPAGTAEPAGSPPLPQVIRRLGAGTWVVTYAVFCVGTVVTGSGPHAGDAKAARLHLRPAAVAQLHADLVMLLVGLAVALAVAVTALGSSVLVRQATRLLIGALALQAAIGFAQYFTHLPIALVELHLIGAAVLASVVTAVVLALDGPFATGNVTTGPPGHAYVTDPFRT
jgi:cytochrome c oxidase assembly protein subunit 15